MTTDQVIAATLEDLQGSKDMPTLADPWLSRREWVSSGGGNPGPLPLILPSPPKQPPAGGSVSANSLRRKVSKASRKAHARALSLSQKGDYRGAAQELEQLVKRDPEYAEAHGNLGVQYVRLGRYREAEVEMRRSIELDPGQSVIHSNLAWVVGQMGNLVEAEKYLRRALALSGANAKAHYMLGVLLGLSPETEAEGRRHVEFAARTIPEAATTLRAFPGR